MTPALVIPVVLSGGTGTRLWPLSRNFYPKQLIEILPPGSLFTQTLDRVANPAIFAKPIIVCNDEHRFIIAEQLRQSGVAARAIVLEAVGRNTAPAATVASLIARHDSPDAIVLIMPSDHVIRDRAAFTDAIRRAIPAVEQGYLVTFGVAPTRPETGYGYIQRGESIADAPGCHRAASFIEKPGSEVATRLLAAGNHFWNSGLFLFRARDFLDELAALRPEILAACARALAGVSRDLDFLRLDAEEFAANPGISIDKAVMERSDRVAVVPVEFAWSDVGSWAALWEIGDKDAAANVTSGNVVLHDVQSTYVHTSHRLVTAIGVSDLVVVATNDAVLVLPKSQSENVRHLVERLTNEQRVQIEANAKVLRPWGHYQVIEAGDRFQVKRLIVNPGCRLSSQTHQHRTEHWVVVEGKARITLGQKTMPLHENESAFVPAGMLHRLENPGHAPLQIIEVQWGNYLGEDDILRFEDDAGRPVGASIGGFT
jgi:mannose-1-phosphate guanylyltransferase/mannose-6-phosphate isomerase